MKFRRNTRGRQHQFSVFFSKGYDNFVFGQHKGGLIDGFQKGKLEFRFRMYGAGFPILYSICLRSLCLFVRENMGLFNGGQCLSRV